jgi:uncharacterized membrane protein
MRPGASKQLWHKRTDRPDFASRGLLARVVLGERMRALQQAGLALAALGIVLVTA